jgi:hypothetical protein
MRKTGLSSQISAAALRRAPPQHSQAPASLATLASTSRSRRWTSQRRRLVAFLPIELRCQDFVEAIGAWEGQLDVVWIGLSLHHLRSSENLAFMGKIERLLPHDGLFLIWEPTCLHGEDREGWVERFSQFLKGLPLSDGDFVAIDSHQRASDYAETAVTWKGMAREAGFEQANEIFASPDQLTSAYLFRH